MKALRSVGLTPHLTPMSETGVATLRSLGLVSDMDADVSVTSDAKPGVVTSSKDGGSGDVRSGVPGSSSGESGFQGWGVCA